MQAAAHKRAGLALPSSLNLPKYQTKKKRLKSSDMTENASSAPRGAPVSGKDNVQARVIFSPDRRPLDSRRPSVFLAGTTSATGEADWRTTLTSSLSNFRINILNPYSADWAGPSNADFVEWELDMQEVADIVVVFFHSVSLAPISLLELGMCIKSGKAIVCALAGYEKRGNVEAVCRRYGVPLVSSEGELAAAVMSKLSSMGL